MPLKQEGKVVRVQGIDIRLYPVSKLASELSKALGCTRTTQTVRKWEVKGVLPPAMFRIANNRMYSMEQIKLICKIAKEEQIKQGCSESMARFSERASAELRKINKNFMARARNGVQAKERK